MTLSLEITIEPKDYWKELLRWLPSAVDENRIKKAYEFALSAHNGQKRLSGEDYISHPAWIAKVVAQLGVGEEAIIAALLHDCVEDTAITVDNIADNFGDEVALLVAGMTEVRKNTKTIEVHQTDIEVFRKFLFSSVNDVRVLIIRLVDKLHNGLTITALPVEKQLRYANQVMGIYGPVAEYVGLHYFKQKLEDIAFKILFPGEAVKIEKMIRLRTREEKKAMLLLKDSFEKLLTTNRLSDYKVESRIKGLYSTFLRTKRRIGNEALLDRVGIRIIVKNIADCYSALGLLHASYEYLPEEFNDYISAPKSSGYRSIQTTINWRNKLTVEVQIRTKEMHEFNEFGPASHIAYKMGKKGGSGYEWVRDLVKWQAGNNKINNYTISVLRKYVYVFTPKGDTIQLPLGSTALDFAYRIHKDIGDHCAGALINNKMGKIDQELKTGDMVEILTSKKVHRAK